MSVDYTPDILADPEGEGPVFVACAVAHTPAEAILYAVDHGEIYDHHSTPSVREVLMRELDPIACKIRGVEEGYWVVCTIRAKRPKAFWRIDPEEGTA